MGHTSELVTILAPKSVPHSLGTILYMSQFFQSFPCCQTILDHTKLMKHDDHIQKPKAPGSLLALSLAITRSHPRGPQEVQGIQLGSALFETNALLAILLFQP